MRLCCTYHVELLVAASQQAPGRRWTSFVMFTVRLSLMSSVNEQFQASDNTVLVLHDIRAGTRPSLKVKLGAPSVTVNLLVWPLMLVVSDRMEGRTVAREPNSKSSTRYPT